MLGLWPRCARTADEKAVAGWQRRAAARIEAPVVDGAGREHVESFELPDGEQETITIGPLSELEAFAEGVRPRLLVKRA